MSVDKAWAQAAKNYKDGYGKVMESYKNAPQLIIKDAQSMCNITAYAINEEVPKEAPKKNF